MKDNLVYHYTKWKTIDSILCDCYKNGKQNIILRGSHIRYMNDPTEMELGYDVLKEMLEDIEDELNRKEGFRLSRFFKDYGNAKECKQAIMNEMNAYNDIPYVVSFSHNGSSLPMWEMYGDKGRGVCLAFDENEVKLYQEKNLARYHDAVYENHVNDQKLKNFLKEIYDDCYKSRAKAFTQDEMVFELGLLCLAISPIIKHKCYKYEKEARLFKCGVERRDIKHDNSLRPYVEFPFPKSALKKIILGPCTHFETEKVSLLMKLETCGFVNAKDMIEFSDVPYRLLL